MAAADITSVLRANRQRLTQPRLAVWGALTQGGHLTAEEIAERVWTRQPDVNLASVYRSLALFDRLGLARKSHLGDEPARWEVAHPHEQFHLVCEHCGRVDHHTGDLVEQVRTHLRAEQGFAARVVDVTVSGACASCASDRASAS